MSYVHPAWEEHQRKRFMAPNPERFWRPDAARWMTPEAARQVLPESMWPKEPPRKITAEEVVEEEKRQREWDAELAALRREHLEIKRLYAEYKLKLALQAFMAKAYHPNQPRVPAGNPDGGQWTSDGSTAVNSGPKRTQFAQNDTRPPLRRIHPDTTYESDSEAKRSLNYWRQQPTDRIVESLKPDQKNPLTAKADGSISDGNTRIKVLQERGYDVNSLPRVPHSLDPPRRGGSRGGGGGALPRLPPRL